MVIFYKKWKKYNEIQLTKNKMDLNIQKMTNHPPSPVKFSFINFGQFRDMGLLITLLHKFSSINFGQFRDMGLLITLLHKFSSINFSQFRDIGLIMRSIVTISGRFLFVHLQLHCWKKASIIQYGNRKCGTHARVFSQTPTHDAWEQQELNEITKQRKKVRREE